MKINPFSPNSPLPTQYAALKLVTDLVRQAKKQPPRNKWNALLSVL